MMQSFQPVVIVSRILSRIFELQLENVTQTKEANGRSNYLLNNAVFVQRQLDTRSVKNIFSKRKLSIADYDYLSKVLFCQKLFQQLTEICVV